MAQRPLVGQGFLIIEASRSHSDTPHFSGRVTSPKQRPLRDKRQHSQETDTHAPGRIRTHDISKRAVADLRLKIRLHRRQKWHNSLDRLQTRKWKSSTLFFTAAATVNPIGRLIVDCWIGFNVAATISNKMAGYYFLVWSLSRLSCRFWHQCSRNLRPRGHRERQLSTLAMLIQDGPTNT